ncbi:IS110 family transposase [Caloranaerobacter sp. DY30410]|uniref:IS110 family transposase n=1 Tax=Caloranaerobacter sp. DY30410 TaxID=3238305 RepID=UPI003CFD3F29
MIIVGIDIGKFNHEATLIDIQGNTIGKSIRFSNSHQGTNKLLKLILEVLKIIK